MWSDMDGVINEQASVSNLLGISPASAGLSGYEGQVLPASTYSGADRAAVPWSPDSPLFWGGVVAFATLLGLIGASARVRFGKTTAQGSVGNA